MAGSEDFLDFKIFRFSDVPIYPFPVSSDLASEMLSAANSAVQHARKYWSTELDFSKRSIEDVELILARMYESIPRRTYQKLFKKKPSPEQMATLSVAYGAYLGEVIRREFGGNWSKQDVTGEPALALVFEKRHMIFPPAKIWKRLSNGEEDNIWTFYNLICEKLKEERGGKSS
jgi:hypothetical protein